MRCASPSVTPTHAEGVSAFSHSQERSVCFCCWRTKPCMSACDMYIPLPDFGAGSTTSCGMRTKTAPVAPPSKFATRYLRSTPRFLSHPRERSKSRTYTLRPAPAACCPGAPPIPQSIRTLCLPTLSMSFRTPLPRVTHAFPNSNLSSSKDVDITYAPALPGPIPADRPDPSKPHPRLGVGQIMSWSVDGRYLATRNDNMASALWVWDAEDLSLSSVVVQV